MLHSHSITLDGTEGIKTQRPSKFFNLDGLGGQQEEYSLRTTCPLILFMNQTIEPFHGQGDTLGLG